MRKRQNLCKQSLFGRIFPHSRLVLVSSVPAALAYQRLERAIATGIVIEDKYCYWNYWRFWGSLKNNQLTFFGPRTAKRFCFRTQGLLFTQGNYLVLHLLIEPFTWDLGVIALGIGFFLYYGVSVDQLNSLPSIVGVLAGFYFFLWVEVIIAENTIFQVLERVLDGTLPKKC